MSRTQIILDAGGVIINNFPSEYWVEIAQLYKTQPDLIRDFMKTEVRNALWTGSISEQALWEWLNERYKVTITPNMTQQLLKKHLKLLPSAQYISEWSHVADIHLLSNHRHEWILELLQPIKPYLQSITISSQVGCCKPDPEIYKIVQSKMNSSRIVYVDDQERNFHPARELGWTTMLADVDGNWIDHITHFLEK